SGRLAKARGSASANRTPDQGPARRRRLAPDPSPNRLVDDRFAAVGDKAGRSPPAQEALAREARTTLQRVHVPPPSRPLGGQARLGQGAPRGCVCPGTP